MKDFIAISSTVHERVTQPEDPRLGQGLATNGAEHEVANGIAILGYPDDEGVQLSFGRVGAKFGPDEIRKDLYGLQDLQKIKKRLYDCGNLDIQGDLKARHEIVKKTIFKLFRNKNKVLTFGGGHDYAYGDIAGFLDCTLKLKKRPVVINVDAHLDMRRPVHGLSSGTPFYRLLSEYKGFDLLTVGTHEHCNAKAHYAYAKDKKVKVINFPDINKFLALCKKLKASQRPIFLSIDMDAFSSYYAPGVSAAWPIGISPEAFSKFFKILLKGQVCGVGIYEVSPPLDENRKTTRLAALIAYEYLKSL